jgi:T5orf172 domain
MKPSNERGLTSRINAGGRRVWYVRCAINSQMRHFGSFASKHAARAFYQSMKKNQLKERVALLSPIHHDVPAPHVLLPQHTAIMFGEAIYFLECLPNGPVKIGHSQKLSRRLLALTATNGAQTRFLGAIAGSKAQEQRLHEQFKHIRDHHEWYHCHIDLLQFLVQHGMEPAMFSERLNIKRKPRFTEAKQKREPAPLPATPPNL